MPFMRSCNINLIQNNMNELYNISPRREGKSQASFYLMETLLKRNMVVTYSTNKNCFEVKKEFKNRLDIDVTLTKISSHIFDIKICK